MNNMQPKDMEDNLEGKKTGKEEYDNSAQHPHYLPPGQSYISATVHIAEPVLVRGVVRHVHDFTKKQFFVKKNRNIICMELFKM